MTTYNYGHFIEESIESVLSQDYPLDRRELVIVDDGSTDDTADRVRNYGSKVRYFFKPNGVQASALNLGFASARGRNSSHCSMLMIIGSWENAAHRGGISKKTRSWNGLPPISRI
jgi:glycosyltransferase involved in cell wall biosynthesis